MAALGYSPAVPEMFFLGIRSLASPDLTASPPLRPPQRLMVWLVWLHYGLGIFTCISALPFISPFFGGWEILHGEPGQPASDRALNSLEWVRWLPPDYDPPLRAAWVIMLTAAFITMSVAHGLLLVYIGRCLARRRRFFLCVLFSILNVTHIPLGTVLSIYTLVVILRPEMKALFIDPKLKPS
jgi:magnesium-transporting ATPase (P-type)